MFTDTIQAKEPGMTSLHELLAGTAGPAAEYAGLLNSNAGRPTISISLTVSDAVRHTMVYNDPDNPEETAQRELNESHANGLAVYFIHAAAVSAIAERERLGKTVPPAYRAIVDLMGPQSVFVMAPWTANLRGVDLTNPKQIEVDSLARLNGIHAVKVRLMNNAAQISWSLLDGQHRRGGLDRAIMFLKYITTAGHYPSGKGRRSYFGLKGPVPSDLVGFWQDVHMMLDRMTVTVDLHIGLTVDEERQAFADLNNKVRKVATDLSYQYDQANPIVVFIKDELSGLIGPDEDGGLSLTELAGVNAIAFQNKTNVRGALAAQVAERKAVVRQMWDAIQDTEGFGDPEVTVIVQPVIQKAIAKLLYDFAFSKSRTDEDDEHLQTLLANLNDVDFGHDNPLWRFFLLPENQREGAKAPNAIKGLAAYLPRNEDGTLVEKDLGVYQNGRFAFSVKHNDVYPVIADMIRFKLGLPSRHTA